MNTDPMPAPAPTEDFATRLQRQVEQERSALARELHDEIGGALAALHIDLCWLADHAADSALQARATAADETLQGAIAAMRRIVQQLRPPILDAGLLPALEWLARDVESRAGFAVSIDLSGLARTVDTKADPSPGPAPEPLADLPPAVQLVAYRSAQEALTNAMKHAACTQVTLALSDRSGVLTLEIKDDGRGLTRDALDDPRRFGLRGLAERAQAIGGWLDVSSPGRAGTSIVLSIPLAARAVEDAA
ncbi:conserved hypothetical protein [Burkholderiales bacterium 8X]|nr:conserved hypothetical protein [Burkholderiales bacterium 8X]